MISPGAKPNGMHYDGQAACAERAALELEAQGLTPDIDMFTAIIVMCATSGDSARAEKWFDKMRSAGIKPNVECYSAMIDSCAGAGDLVHAEFWHILMVKRGVPPNSKSFTAVINACARAGNASAAGHWLARMQSAGVSADVDVYGAVLDACAKAWDCSRGEDVFRQMCSHGISPTISTYVSLARPYAHQGNWPEVERLADLMAQDGLVMNDKYLHTMLLAYANGHPCQADRAEVVLRKAYESGVEVNPFGVVLTTAVRAMGQKRCNKLVSELDVSSRLLKQAKPKSSARVAPGPGSCSSESKPANCESSRVAV